MRQVSRTRWATKIEAHRPRALKLSMDARKIPKGEEVSRPPPTPCLLFPSPLSRTLHIPSAHGGTFARVSALMRASVHAAGCGAFSPLKGARNARIVHMHGSLLSCSAHDAMVLFAPV